MATAATVASYQAGIVKVLRERLPDIPLSEVVEGTLTEWPEGICVYRFTRTRKDAGVEMKGTMVRVMYHPERESEILYPERVARVREVLLEVFGHRWRPLRYDGSGVLIEDPRTRYSRERKADYEFRQRMGWQPLHEMGK